MNRDRKFVAKGCQCVPRSEVDSLLAELGIDYPPCGFHIGRGWLPHVAGALRRMCAAGWAKDLAQVKQKFGGLRLYTTNVVSAEVQAIIDEVELICDDLCEECGEPHGLRVPLSGLALCEGCKHVK